MLSNAYFRAKVCFATAENEPAKNLQNNTRLFPIFYPVPPLCGRVSVYTAGGRRAALGLEVREEAPREAQVQALGHASDLRRTGRRRLHEASGLPKGTGKP